MKKLEVNLEVLQKALKRGTAFVLAGSIALGGHAAIVKDNDFGIQTVCAAEEQGVVNLDVQTGVNLYMNDKGFVPKDVNGNETYPFIYDGTTYVPVRAIAELFNATVNWEEKTRTVVIATTGESAKLTHTPRPKQELLNTTISAETGVRLVINGKEVIPKDVNGNEKDIYIVNGTTYVPVRAVSEALDLPITWSDKSNSVFIGLHKTTGLTVENMDELSQPEKFKELVWDTQKGGTPFMMSFLPPNNEVCVQRIEYYLTFVACMLNEEYLGDDYYHKIFRHYYEKYNYDAKDFMNMITFTTTFSSYLYDAESTGMYLPFDWNCIIIDPEYVNFLNDYTYLLYDAWLTKDYSRFFSFCEDFLYGNTGNVHANNGQPILDFLISKGVIMQEAASYDIDYEIYSDFYTDYLEGKTQIYIKHSDMLESLKIKKIIK